MSLIHEIIKRKAASALTLLLEDGACVEERDENGATPIETAVEHCPELVPLLVSFGAGRDAKDESGAVRADVRLEERIVARHPERDLMSVTPE